MPPLFVSDTWPTPGACGSPGCTPTCSGTTFVTIMLDAGVDPRDVQIAARHADPRTTTRYDRARDNLDRHASYIVTAFIAGAA